MGKDHDALSERTTDAARRAEARPSTQVQEEDTPAPELGRVLYSQNSGVYQSTKMGTHLPYSKAAEINLLYLLDSSPQVLAFRLINGDPDLEEVFATNGTGPAFAVQTPAYTAAVSVAPSNPRHHSNIGYSISIAHEQTKLPSLVFKAQDLARSFYINNIRALTEYAYGTLQAGIRARIYEILDTADAAKHGITIKAIRESLDFATDAPIRYLLYHRELIADLRSTPLAEYTRIFLPHQADPRISYPPPQLAMPHRPPG